jgi:Trypsin-like peptidase domain
MRDLGVSEGDFAYVIGFPLGMVGDQRSFATVRGGPIARVRDALQGLGGSFLVDACTYPGNSGGPVVLKPELVSVHGTAPQVHAQVIGISSESISYRDVAISRQTQRERIVFEDNTGLTKAHLMDLVDEAVRQHLASVPGALGPAEPAPDGAGASAPEGAPG